MPSGRSGRLIGVTRVEVVVLAFGFSDFALGFFGFFTASSSDAVLCALSLASPSSSLGARRFGIIEAGGTVDRIRGNIARRRHDGPDLANAFHHTRRPQSTPIASVSGRQHPTSTLRSEFFHSTVEE